MIRIDVSGLDSNQKDRVLEGKCPYCSNPIASWKPMFGSFAPEWWQTLREQGIDPRSGHAIDCRHKEIQL